MESGHENHEAVRQIDLLYEEVHETGYLGIPKNTLISYEQTDDDHTSTTENDEQPTVKKLCTSSNSFTNTKYQHKNSTDNHRSSKIPVVTCIPSTSPSFTSQSGASLQNHDVDNRRGTSTNHLSSPSFSWDTFKNYGELSGRQKLIVLKSPLHYSQVMYGGSSARSNLSTIFCNIPPIHRKKVIPISPSSNSEITTTSSIRLEHISSKNKEIKENKFTIQPKVHQRHKADQKRVPVKVESTVKIVETTPEKTGNHSSEILSTYSGRVDANTTRKLPVNLSKKVLGLNSDELEMPTEVNLPRISLPLTALPNINLSSTFTEDNKFTFSQPLTIEQYISQIAEETLKKSQNTNIEVNSIDQSSTKIPSKNFNILTSESLIKESEKVAIINNDTAIENSNENDKLSQLSSVVDDPQNSLKTSLPCSGSKSKITKSVDINVNSSPKKLESINKTQLTPEKSSTKLKKKRSCDACWVSNDADNIMKCIACQTPKHEKSQTPLLKVIKSSTWTCETCWVHNKNEIEVCVACQKQNPGTTNKTVVQSVTCTCSGWVKNKSDCTICISCETSKPGSAAENKPLPSTQFKFGLNNYTFEDSKIDQTSNNQFKFGSAISDNRKLDTSASAFKCGLVNNKTYLPLSTFIFGTDSISSLPVKKFNEGSIINNTNQTQSQFKFDESYTTNKPIAQFKFVSDKIETEKSIFQNPVTNSNIVTQSTNECTSPINNKKEESENSLELQNKINKCKVNDASEHSSRQVSFGSVETNCNDSKPLINVEIKNVDPSKVKKLVWGKKIVIKPTVHFCSNHPVESVFPNTNHFLNGHSHPNQSLNENQKPGLIKSSQLFNFGSLAKQNYNVPFYKKNQNMMTFGPATSDNKLFTSLVMGTNSIPSSVPVFGASSSMFGSGPTTSTPATFGSFSPQISNNFFSKT